MRTRLAALAPGLDEATVTTFHGLGLRILRDLHGLAGLPAPSCAGGPDGAAGGRLDARPRIS